MRGVVVLANVSGSVAQFGPAAAFLTGEDGRFVFRDLPAGTVNLFASKTGYLHGEGGPFRLRGGDRTADVRLGLTPEGVISGRIVDQFGEPVANARVRAVPPGARPSVGEPALTDDSGRYAIAGLERGLYLVQAEGAAVGAAVSYESVFFPAATIAGDATAIEVDPGVERAGADMTVTLLVKPSNYVWKELLSDAPDVGVIAGVVRDTSGRSLAHTSVMLRLVDGGTTTRMTSSDSEGRFQFDGVPPGRFNVAALRPGYESPPKAAPGTGAWKVIELRPGQRELGVAMALAKSASIGGRILDQFGDPIVGSVALRRVGGVISLPGRQTQSNARGEYRILSIESGDWILSVEDNPFGRDLRTSVSPDQEQTVAMLPVFYPGVPEASLATTLTVTAGSDLTNMDLVMRPQPVSVIDVEVDADGRTHSRSDDRPVGPDARTHRPRGRSGRRMARGGGSNRRQRAGTRSSRRPLRSGRTDRAAVSDCGPRARLAAMASRRRRSRSCCGRAAASAAPSCTKAPFRTARCVSVLSSADSPRPRVAGPITEIGTIAGSRRTFTVGNIEPGKYFLSALDVKQTSTVKSIVIDGRDAQDRPLDFAPGTDLSNVVITLTDQLTQISGAVSFDPIADPIVTVLAFPADPQFWDWGLLGQANADGAGRAATGAIPSAAFRQATIESRRSSPAISPAPTAARACSRSCCRAHRWSASDPEKCACKTLRVK